MASSGSFEIAEMPLPASNVPPYLPPNIGWNHHEVATSPMGYPHAPNPLDLQNRWFADGPADGTILESNIPLPPSSPITRCPSPAHRVLTPRRMSTAGVRPVPSTPMGHRHSASFNGIGRRWFGEGLGELDTNIALFPSSRPGTRPSSPTKTELSPKRMSIADLNLEPGVNASIEETNISLDDIAQFIDPPEVGDNRWTCKYEGCHKRFGRKENIKSHVQTHLGDRQFKCDHCNKCFVRGHDLKRHAKIHTGSKPYPCLCGNSFARHDALTRHRQRGNCIGAFDGVVKKVVKKGRPRKPRPDMEDRLDKANRTRQRAEEKDFNYASSDTDSPASTHPPSSPTKALEALSIRGHSPFDDIPLFDVDITSQPMHSNMSFPPDLFTFTPPASPSYSVGNRSSPRHRSVDLSDMSDMGGEMPNFQSQLLFAIHEEEPTTAASTPPDQKLRLHHHNHNHHRPSPPVPSLSRSSSSPVPDLLSFELPPAVSNSSPGHGLSLGGGGGGGGSGGEHDSITPSKTVLRSSLGAGGATAGAGADFESFLDYSGMGLESGEDSFFNL